MDTLIEDMGEDKDEAITDFTKRLRDAEGEVTADVQGLSTTLRGVQSAGSQGIGEAQTLASTKYEAAKKVIKEVQEEATRVEDATAALKSDLTKFENNEVTKIGKIK